MKYLWTEDTGAGLHFWKLVNQLFYDGALTVSAGIGTVVYRNIQRVLDVADRR